MVALLGEDHFINRGVGLNRDVSAAVLVGHEISASGSDSIVDGTRHMATTVGDISSAEHVMIQWHALRDERVEQ